MEIVACVAVCAVVCVLGDYADVGFFVARLSFSFGIFLCFRLFTLEW